VNGASGETPVALFHTCFVNYNDPAIGKDAVATQIQLSAQISGPLADQLRKHSEAAGALANRLQEDLRTSEEAVRRVHHHLIDASRFILSKVDDRR